VVAVQARFTTVQPQVEQIPAAAAAELKVEVWVHKQVRRAVPVLLFLK
jgi:hypothetical protein